MANKNFPPLNLKNWQSTRDTLHIYSKLLGKIRAAFTPAMENWWHIALHVDDTGLSTTPIPIPNTSKTLNFQLNLLNHHLVFNSPNNKTKQISLQKQNPNTLYQWSLARLNALNLDPKIDPMLFANQNQHPYETSHASTYFTALSSINQTFQQFKASLSGKTSPVLLWPHHFDISVSWFSGRQANVPEGEEEGEEQIGFGFSTGDEGINEAYFYATPWPLPNGILNTPLPGDALWHTKSWTGGLLHYNKLIATPNPEATLLSYLEAVHKNSVQFMG